MKYHSPIVVAAVLIFAVIEVSKAVVVITLAIYKFIRSKRKENSLAEMTIDYIEDELPTTVERVVFPIIVKVELIATKITQVVNKVTAFKDLLVLNIQSVKVAYDKSALSPMIDKLGSKCSISVWRTTV